MYEISSGPRFRYSPDRGVEIFVATKWRPLLSDFGGIAEANLLDKTADESISGSYVFQGSLRVDGPASNDYAAFKLDAASGLSVVTLGSFTTGSDLDTITAGSAFGGVIQGQETGHLAIGIRENDIGDSVYVVSGGGDYSSDTTYDTVVARFQSNGDVSFPSGNTQLGGNTLEVESGAGVAGADGYASSVSKVGGLFHTRIYVDIDGLVGSASDKDVIGDDDAAAAHFGQITAARNGTPVSGQITCLEAPAGGADDLDFYSDDTARAEDFDITTATNEVALLINGEAWTVGMVKQMTSLPNADDFLYIVNGEGAAGGTFTAGKFLIELFGV